MMTQQEPNTDSVSLASKKAPKASGPARKRGRPKAATGSRTVTQRGYVLVKQDDGKWVPEHVITVERYLGRALYWNDEKKERVIHKDGDKTNNKLSNLLLETTTRRALTSEA